MTTMTASSLRVARLATYTPLVAEAPAAVTPEAPPAQSRWEGIIGFENEMTGDGRVIAANALRWPEDLGQNPIPIRYVAQDVGAHDGAQVVGYIDSITRLAATETGSIPIWGEGVIDDAGDLGAEAYRQVDGKFTNGVSMDLDDVAFEVQVDPANPDQETMTTQDARIRAATIVAIPAFAGARINIQRGEAYQYANGAAPTVFDVQPQASEGGNATQAEQQAENPRIVVSTNSARGMRAQALTNARLRRLAASRRSVWAYQTTQIKDPDGEWVETPAAAIDIAANSVVPDDPFQLGLAVLQEADMLELGSPEYLDKTRAALPYFEEAVSNGGDRAPDAKKIVEIINTYLDIDWPEPVDPNAPAEEQDPNAPVQEAPQAPAEAKVAPASPPAPAQGQQPAQGTVQQSTAAEITDANEFASMLDGIVTATFGFNPDQWRNPRNGRWIDMPGRILDMLGDYDWTEKNREAIGRAQDPAYRFSGALNEGDVEDALFQINLIEDSLAEVDLDDEFDEAGEVLEGAKAKLNELRAVDWFTAQKVDADGVGGWGDDLEPEISAEQALEQAHGGPYAEPIRRDQLIARINRLISEGQSPESAAVQALDEMKANDAIPGEPISAPDPALQDAIDLIRTEVNSGSDPKDFERTDPMRTAIISIKNGRTYDEVAKAFLDDVNSTDSGLESIDVQMERNAANAAKLEAPAAALVDQLIGLPDEKLNDTAIELKDLFIQQVSDGDVELARATAGRLARNVSVFYGGLIEKLEDYAQTPDDDKVVTGPFILDDNQPAAKHADVPEYADFTEALKAGDRKKAEQLKKDLDKRVTEIGDKLYDDNTNTALNEEYDNAENASIDMFQELQDYVAESSATLPRSKVPVASLQPGDRFIDRFGDVWEVTGLRGTRTEGAVDGDGTGGGRASKILSVRTKNVATGKESSMGFNPAASIDVVDKGAKPEKQGELAATPAMPAGWTALPWAQRLLTTLGTQPRSEAWNALTPAEQEFAKQVRVGVTPAEAAAIYVASVREAHAPKHKIAGEYNWVEDTGGLPKYIREIADSLMKRGFAESRAIATAVETVKRWAKGGPATKGGKGHVKADTIAKAAAALAEWEAKRVAAKANAATTETLGSGKDGCTCSKDGEGNCVVHGGKHSAALVSLDRPHAGALVASIGGSTIPIDPPKAWFMNPLLKEPTPIRIDDNGRIYGHLASWNVCHVGSPSGEGVCVMAPRNSTGYAYFHTGTVKTEEGELIATGRLVMGGGHANTRLNAMAASAHYDATSMAVADVKVGEDQYGIWVAGALRPDVDKKKARALRASPLSGDWRRIAGKLELVIGLAVNAPGLPIPRVNGLVASAYGDSESNEHELITLVAAGMLVPEKVFAPGEEGAFSVEDLRYLKALALKEKEYELDLKRERIREKARELAVEKNKARVKAFAAVRLIEKGM